MTDNAFFNWPTPANAKWSSSRLCPHIFKFWCLDCTWKPAGESRFWESAGYLWIESSAEQSSERLISWEELSGCCSQCRLSSFLARSCIVSPRVRFSIGNGEAEEQANS